MLDDNYNDFMSRSPEEVYLAIMDKLNIKIDFAKKPDERPIWQAAAANRNSAPRHINCRCSIKPITKK